MTLIKVVLLPLGGHGHPKYDGNVNLERRPNVSFSFLEIVCKKFVLSKASMFSPIISDAMSGLSSLACLRRVKPDTP